MLSKNCEKKVVKFLEKGQCNVKITIVDKVPMRSGKLVVEESWKDTIKKSLGGSIINDSKTMYSVSCRNENEILNFTTTGNKIVETFWEYIKKSTIVRFDLTKTKDFKTTKSWIIVRD